jgi:glycosyltransferase involved in cell wall biosynthesis
VKGPGVARLTIHVAHTVPALFGRDGVVGGAERYALELARHMADEVPTTLVSFGDRDREERLGALHVRVLGSPWLVRGQRANPMSRRLFAALRSATVVHCHQQHVLASSLGALYCRLTGRRVFVTDLGGGGWDISAYVPTDRWYHGHLHISDYSRRVFGHATDPRARVISGGVDTGTFAPDGRAARGDTVVFVGRLLPHKGVDGLIQALPDGLRLLVIGARANERYAADLDRLARGKPVTFLHDADDARIVDAYRTALCVVLPSVYRTMYGDTTPVPELLGQTLLEGMACGAPAICTDVASMPEVVDDGRTGFVVPAHDPAALGARLTWLREHPDAARRMGDAARRRVEEHFTWPLVVRRCLEAYTDRAPAR